MAGSGGGSGCMWDTRRRPGHASGHRSTLSGHIRQPLGACMWCWGRKEEGGGVGYAALGPGLLLCCIHTCRRGCQRETSGGKLQVRRASPSRRPYACVRECRREQDSAVGRALPRRGVEGEICPAAALALAMAVRQVRLGEAAGQTRRGGGAGRQAGVVTMAGRWVLYI